ncbi:hypothetical protein OG474_15480 [Kribbella sp. NBC_01505]|uniref:hypothetical protein n=1 Tax=Kribbella sp. NBC_01505 TaxID=2903580 RepID=UPI00386CFB10
MPRGIQVLPARDFAADTVAINPRRALRAVVTMSSRRRFPPELVDDLLLVLQERYGMDEVVELLGAARGDR